MYPQITMIFISLTIYTFWAARRSRHLIVLPVFSLIQIFHPLGKISHMICGIVDCINFCGYIVLLSLVTESLSIHNTDECFDFIEWKISVDVYDCTPVINPLSEIREFQVKTVTKPFLLIYNGRRKLKEFTRYTNWCENLAKKVRSLHE
ncbi:hypothetical protein M0R45_035541 [Rubus argutus]|uniref:Uncharacterized protein n=1 Tax=Rubus argutus TaxID=59490 RepID=A0AAW1VV69_RUBAR